MQISKRGSVATAVAIVGATATTAMAVPPPPSSSFQGETSQSNIRDHAVAVDTDAGGHVSQVSIDWRAKCKVKGKFWTASTTIGGGDAGLPQSGDVFSKKGSYTSNAGGGVKGRVTAALQGSFSDNDTAN